MTPVQQTMALVEHYALAVKSGPHNYGARKSAAHTALLAHIEELVRDAGRYRWLEAAGEISVYFDKEGCRVLCTDIAPAPRATSLRAAIDAVMNPASKEPTP